MRHVLIEDSDTVTLTAKVTLNNTVVTDSLAASLFTWTRDSGDAAADGIWNDAHSGMKSVQIAGSELAGTTKFTCNMRPLADYGEFFPAVENGIVLKHERGSANPNDTFAISDSNLTVDTNASPNPYSFDDPMLSVNSTSIAGPLTAGMYVYAAAPTREIRFFYNADGLRTRKQAVLGGRIIETTDYTLHGKLVTEMKHSTAEGTDVLHFFYDAQSRPAMVKWNGVMYSYVHNLQGDIVAILDCEGNKVVEYRYDAWGKSLGTDGTLKTSLGLLNPFRYRGYVYDEETGLYYLRSRYYGAETGRFVCADAIIATNSDIFSINVFLYCKNNPITSTDTSGYLPHAITDKRVHNRVLADIVRRDISRQLTMHHTCIYYNRKNILKGWGFCDLYNKSTGEVWELKKVDRGKSRSLKTLIALTQLNKYVNGRLKSNPDLELTFPVHDNPRGIMEGSLEYQDEIDGYDYHVKYWSDGNCILRYDYSRTKGQTRQEVEDTIETAVSVMVGGLLTVAGFGMGAGNLPAF